MDRPPRRGSRLDRAALTRSLSYESEPAPGRIRFFAIAAMVANVIFLLIVLLDGFASIFSVECRGS